MGECDGPSSCANCAIRSTSICEREYKGQRHSVVSSFRCHHVGTLCAVPPLDVNWCIAGSWASRVWELSAGLLGSFCAVPCAVSAPCETVAWSLFFLLLAFARTNPSIDMDGALYAPAV